LTLALPSQYNRCIVASQQFLSIEPEKDVMDVLAAALLILSSLCYGAHAVGLLWRASRGVEGTALARRGPLAMALALHVASVL
jgi:hypothetical protein